MAEPTPLQGSAPSVLTSEILPGGVAPMPNVPAAANQAAGSSIARPADQQRGGTIKVDPTEEYVAGGYGSSALAFAKSLPSYIDDISHDFGPDIYDRMLLDAHVAGEVNAYRLSVLANGINLLPSHPRPIDAMDVAGERLHETANQVLDFCARVLDELDTPIGPVISDMIGAFALGNKVAEIVYRRDGSFLMPDRLKVKRRETFAFVTDSRGNLIGLLGAIAGQTQQVVRPGIIVDPKVTPNILPRNKFAVLTMRPQNADPRGTSALRPAYNPWWQKRQTEIELAKYIAQFAGSMMVGTTAEGAQAQQLTNPDGTYVTDADGNPLMVSPQKVLLDQMLTLKNGGVIVGAHGTDIKNLVAIGAGQPFFANLERCNKEITKAILTQTLATNEGEHQARAASGNAKDVMDILIQEGEAAVALMIRRDLLKQAVLLNFGPDYLRFLPHVTLSSVEEADLGETAKGYATLGYRLAASQLPEIDAKLGLTVRDPDEAALESEEDDTDEDDPKKAKFAGKKKARFLRSLTAGRSIRLLG
ncbi:MAG: DUF935 family protein [Armatimonadota bacterium]